MMPCDVYTGTSILIVGFIIINYRYNYYFGGIYFQRKRLNEISENKFSSKITRYTVYVIVIPWA